MSSSFHFTGWFMEESGATLLIIGLSIAVSALTEVPFMLRAESLAVRAGPVRMLGAGAGLMALKVGLLVAGGRWGLTGLYFAAQALHGAAFAIYYNGVVQFVDRRVHPDLRTTGLNLYFTAWMLGSALSGYFSTTVLALGGSTALMVVDGLAMALLAVIVAVLTRT